MRVDPHTYGDRREVPKYNVAEVALYLGINVRTLRNWFFGYYGRSGGRAQFHNALVTPALRNPHGPSLSFYNLAEAQVLAAMRQKWSIHRDLPDGKQNDARLKFGLNPRRTSEVNISLQAIRSAIEYVSKQSSATHPLISQYFYTDGKSVFVRVLEESIGGHLVVNASRGGQVALSSVLEAYLERLTRDHLGWPIKIYPLRDFDDHDKSIVIMPSVASGRPTVAGTGVQVEVIWNRFNAGETKQELSEDYGIEPGVIEKAISYFGNLKAA